MLVKRETSPKRGGPSRFRSRTYEGVYRIRKVGRHTCQVQDLPGKTAEVPLTQPVSADRLIKLNKFELNIDENQLRRLFQLQMSHGGDWMRHGARRFTADGQVEVVRAAGK